MGRRWIRIGTVAAVLTVVLAGLASADKPTVIPIGGPLAEFNGGFSPKKLPKNKLAPITLEVSDKVSTADGSQLPVLKEVDLDVDKNVSVNAGGLPICRFSVEDPPPSGRCRPAIVGRGVMEVEVRFPEEEPINVSTALLAFNGGVKGGTTRIFIHAYLSSPVNGAIVTTVKVSKERRGRLGTRWAFTIPKIAGGYGLVKEFDLTLDREFAYGGKRRSYLLAKCPDGHLNAQATSIFADGTTIENQFVRACTPTS